MSAGFGPVDDFGSVLIAAFGLVLVIEGLIYALFPAGMKRVMVQVLELPPSVLRNGGLVAAAVGCVIIWLVRR